MPAAPYDQVESARTVSDVVVTAPARLHLGFLDLAGDLGRRFGSLGLAIDGIDTRVRATPAPRLRVEGPEAARAERYARTMAERFGLSDRIAIRVERAIPPHAGLGSGTALALAVGAAMARGAIDPAATAMALGRGQRSGIGIAAFQAGGLVLDGGQAEGAATPPPILARHDFPPDWRVLLVLDEGFQGKHGEAELAAFGRLAPFPTAVAAELCRLVLMQALPALVERDIDRFGAAISRLQAAVGDHFAPAQGGRFSSPVVAEALGWLQDQGVRGVGQSSWGPTGFALLGSEAEARRLAEGARGRFA
ncbi:MAG: GHMP kinase, partial [Rhodospirillales bacterium]|nr:GHMP kinase [Rhodospirillales bacterium]